MGPFLYFVVYLGKLQFVLHIYSFFRSGRACNILKGVSYTGNDDSEKITPNPLNNEMCAQKCSTRRKEHNPRINGMIWYVNTKQCWCMIGMRGEKEWSGYDICYFRGKSFHPFLHQVH